MRVLLPQTLWLLIAAQIEAQAVSELLQLPTAIRKMSPDAGEKLYHSYCAFASHAALSARAEFDALDAQLLAANASARLDSRPPFAPHEQNALTDGRHAAWQLLRSWIAPRQAQWACPAGTSSCAGIGYPNSCCGTGEMCMVVTNTGLGPVGCCPSGSTCGGLLSGCGSGNTACGVELGGGCCIPGYVCQGIGCVRSSTTTLVVVTQPSISPVTTAPTPTNTVVTVIVTQTPSPSPAPSSSTTPPPSSAPSPSATTTTATTTPSTDISAPVRPTSSGPPNPYCPTGFYACLASAGGGCCQTGRDCQTTSCPPISYTTVISDGATVVVPATAAAAAPTGTCAGGWYLCGDDAGPRPGCCPSGYGCGAVSCSLVQQGATASVAKALPGTGAAAGREVGWIGVVWVVVGVSSMILALI